MGGAQARRVAGVFDRRDRTEGRGMKAILRTSAGQFVADVEFDVPPQVERPCVILWGDDRIFMQSAPEVDGVASFVETFALAIKQETVDATEAAAKSLR